ncbi:MAG: hypothetical protein HFJ12_05465 [Bacilli bacterium]|nr:hypothetical protein [Bacilli bacterium]
MLKYELEPNDENLKETIEKNFLGRNSKLVMLSKLLVNVKENLTISVDGKWGSGKTFFIKQFKYLVDHIEDYTEDRIINGNDKQSFKKLHETHLVVYYNAWENDMHTNPLESLIYNILNEYPKMKNQIADFKDFKKMFKSFCRDFLYSVSGELFDINNFDQINSFDDLAKKITTIEEKKIAFNKLVDEILEDKQRLILIIDELDRCKPTFAVEMLEVIKHFYTNDKITIIVSTNNSELSNTIKNYYGNDFDGYGYLNKFYDFIISLEIKDIKSYLQNQFNFCNRTLIYHDLSYLVMNYFDFSLRECNRFITLYNILKAYIESEKHFDRDLYYINTCVFMPIALSLKIKDVNKYNLFISKKGEKIITDFLDSEIIGTDYQRWLGELFKYENDDDFKKKIVDTYYEVFNTEYSYERFPFFEAISLLGTKILIDNKGDNDND